MMKTFFGSFAFIMVVCGCGASALAQVAEAQPKTAPASLSATVSSLEDEFLAELETTKKPEKVFDEYESALTRLTQEHPGETAPFLGLLELFEKCETPRTVGLLNRFLADEKLPKKIRDLYQQIQKGVSLIGTHPGFTFTALDGNIVQIDAFRGKVVIIDFWATWCGPCVRDLPKLKALHAEKQQKGLAIVGVSFDDQRSKLESFIKEREVSWPQIYPTPEERAVLARDFGVSRGYLPTVFLVGKDGLIRHTINSRYQMADKVAVLLKE